MSESFAALFEESLQRTEMRTGEVITAEVVRIDYNFVVVNAGLKSEAYVAIEEFKNDKGELEVQVGDFVSVAIGSIENGYGDTILSRDTAKRLASWLSLEKALESGEFVTQRLVSLREQDHGIQGHQAGPQTQQRGAEPPRCGGSFHG
jgi:small subunit ribosomal protein S1